MSSIQSRNLQRESQNGKYKIEIPKPSNALVTGGICAYVAGIFLLFAFATPYWLVSWQYTFSPFKRMGLWEFCFDRYRHPNYQYDKLFSGCSYIFSDNFLIIREWLLPGWMVAVQAFFTMAFISSFGSQLILAFLVTRWPLSFILRFEWLLSFTCCIGNLAATFLIFLSVAIFGGQCYRRDWLPYPNYNYLSWGYVFAILSMSVHLLAGLVLYGESRASKGRSLPNGLGHRHADSDVQSDMVMQTRTLSPTGTEGMYSYSAASARSGTDSFV